MENNVRETIKIRKMFDTIRLDEARNIKTNKFDDKRMVKRLTDYLKKQANNMDEMGDES